MKRTTYDERLKCGVVSLSYDFENRTGKLHLSKGHCCHMPGCIALFEAIDPEVSSIDTYSGEKADTAYRKEGEEWQAIPPG